MTDGGHVWTDEAEKDVYKRAVLMCLDDPRLSELLERRPAVTGEAVAEAMSASPYVDRLLGTRPDGPRLKLYRFVHRVSDSYRWAHPVTPSLHAMWAGDDRAMWWLGLMFLPPLTFLAITDWGLPWFAVVPVTFSLLVLLPVFRFVRRVVRTRPETGPADPRRHAFRVLALCPLTFSQWALERFTEVLWTVELLNGRMPGQVERAVEDLLGDDRGTLLVPSSHEGLRSPHGRGYFVTNGPTRELRRKMAQLDGGAIAVSGPRGVGKTTLMEYGVRRRDFAVFAHAPATYTPHDFLTSLFVSVCQEYITRAGYNAPEFVRLSYFPRALRQVMRPLKLLLRWLAYALPAAGLIALGLFATERSIESEHGPVVRQHLAAAWEWLIAFVRQVTDGTAPEAALSLVFVGMVLWTLRKSDLFARLLRDSGAAVLWLGSYAFTLGPFLSLYFDPDMRHHYVALRESRWAPLLILAWGLCLLVQRNVPPQSYLRVGRWAVRKKVIYRTLTRLLPFAIVALLATEPSTRPLLTDSEHPIRICVFLLGMLLVALRRRPWSFLRPTPKLVVACRNHLYRLQTVQSSSAALATSGTRLLTLGTTHTSALTTVPPNYPALVAEFRTLLRRIGREESRWGNRVVIAVDEVDRLGTEAQALAFLSEIKGILGVPHVHYLISVAEDVGAGFVRRGLPNRDVTDSSLDDVVHVRRCTLDESAKILKRRAPGIGDAYIVLAHALSGGIPRDLIRYGRRLVEIRAAAELVELPEVAQALVVEELSETLAGFRTLLAKQQWGPDTHGVLKSFRSLAAHLRAACPCPDQAEPLRLAIAFFVAHEVDGLSDEPRRLIDEAAAYTCLSLTLLDIFGRPAFNRRRTRAAQHADGDPDLLAEARQELAVSPYSARALIDDIRRAWELNPVSPEEPRLTVTIPPPRGAACVRHPRA
ncbi:hypothetical protein ACIP2Y_33745 [Streptomyces sviceus]|uniref:hypothetical protein n=1 Tax=Streptomyces sviceus TaxID=285530 RepID=UPI003821957B